MFMYVSGHILKTFVCFVYEIVNAVEPLTATKRKFCNCILMHMLLYIATNLNAAISHYALQEVIIAFFARGLLSIIKTRKICTRE